MKIDCLDRARHLSNEDLLAALKTLAGRERVATAELVAHLAEFDARKLYLPAGCSSLFTYCRDALGMSEHEAYNRIEVARAARRFPIVLDLLAAGAINLTTIRLLAPHLTEENHAAVLESARRLRTPQVEQLVAALAPKPDVPATIRKLPHPAPPSPTAPSSAASSAAIESPAAPLAIPASAPPSAATGLFAAPKMPVPSRPAVVEPLSPDRYKLQLTISGGMLEMLQLAKDLLRHALPSGDDAAVLERALKALLEELMKKKFAATDRPQPSRGTQPGTRYIPADVRRAVYLRDLGQCAYRSAEGRRCGDRAFVEFHHLQPYSHDGPPTVANVELRCHAHNIYEWDREFTEVRIQEDEWYRQRVMSPPGNSL